MSKKKAGLETSDNNEIINFYKHKNMKEFITEYENPCFESHQIKVPFRMSVIGASGGGKTQFLLNLISKCQNTSGHIYVCYKSPEPLYQFLEKIIGSDKITFFTQLSKFIQPNEVPKDKQILMVFDDCVTYSDKQHASLKIILYEVAKLGKGLVCAICLNHSSESPK